MSHKLKEQARFLLEDIQELKRVLLLQKHSLPRRRDERLEAIATLSNKHDLPSRLLPFTGEIDVIVQQVDPFLANQEKLLDVLIHERLHDEIALTILSIQLLLLHQGKKEAAASKIRDFAEGGMLTKDKVMEKPAFQLSKTINKAVDLGLGNHLADAVLVSNLLPFVGGERYLPYIVTGRPVPGFLKEEVDVEVNLKITARETLAGSKFPLDAPGMETLTRDGVRGVTIAGHARAGVSPRGAGIRKNQDRITELENTISEVLPYMIEMVSMELEPLKESLLMRRKILASHGEIGALASLKNQNWTTASYSYQEDAHEYFDKGDVELGWTSLWLALLSLLKGGTRVADIASMFDEIKKKRSEDDGFQNHVLLNVFEMLITCLEHEMTNHARELLPLHDLMPLLEEEREILDYSSLIGH